LRKFGLIGYPLGHSRSKELFEDIFSHERVDDSVYELIPLKDEKALKGFIHNADKLSGFNVTIPHKKTIIRYLDEIDADARAIGAVNCVKVIGNGEGRTLKGFNTDFFAFYETIRHQLLFRRTGVLVLGTGGASAAVCYALEQLKVRYIQVSRNRAGDCIAYDDLTAGVMDDYRIIVNCTPLGMEPYLDDAPPIPYELLNYRHLCYDLIYHPPKTRFLLEAEKREAAIINGLMMLHLQAVKSWEIWSD
jgi:shikimate dehydrogenase